MTESSTTPPGAISPTTAPRCNLGGLISDSGVLDVDRDNFFAELAATVDDPRPCATGSIRRAASAATILPMYRRRFITPMRRRRLT